MRVVTSSVSRLLLVLLVGGVFPAAFAHAQPRLGGHIGIATPLLQVNENETNDISDNTVIVNPIGITVKLTERLAVDFETQVISPVDPSGRSSSFVVAPGVVYNLGPAAVGLRLASEIGQPVNVGLIPLVNRGLVVGDVATWFVEAAFPFFVHSQPRADSDFTFDVVIHTGIAF